MVDLPVLALTLIPLLSGGMPGSHCANFDPVTLFGMTNPPSHEFMIGCWKPTESFSRWGTTDRNRARIEKFRAPALMCLNKNGSMTMVNLFQPERGRWELNSKGLLIYDPEAPEWGSQIIPVGKRDENGIWMMLPFARGAAGIGLVRVSDEEASTIAEQARDPRYRKATARERPSYRKAGGAQSEDLDFSVPDF